MEYQSARIAMRRCVVRLRYRVTEGTVLDSVRVPGARRGDYGNMLTSRNTAQRVSRERDSPSHPQRTVRCIHSQQCKFVIHLVASPRRYPRQLKWAHHCEAPAQTCRPSRISCPLRCGFFVPADVQPGSADESAVQPKPDFRPPSTR